MCVSHCHFALYVTVAFILFKVVFPFSLLIYKYPSSYMTSRQTFLQSRFPMKIGQSSPIAMSQSLSIYCYIMIYHKPSNLKQHTLITSQLLQINLAQSSIQGLTRLLHGIGQGSGLTWSLADEESASKLTWLFSVVGPRALISCRL